MTDAIAQSNSLADLADRIRAEHEATSLSLKRGVEHSMAAGELLIEAKALVKHGQWLPWLRDHCQISDRTARLYMQLARNRERIEKQNRQPIADLTMNEAAALLTLSIGIEKLMEFAAKAALCEGDSEVMVGLATDFGFTVFQDGGYDPFHGRTETEKRDWLLFALAIGDGEMRHVEWLLRNGWPTVDEWLGPQGDGFRAAYGMKSPRKFKAAWPKYRADRAHLSCEEAQALLFE